MKDILLDIPYYEQTKTSANCGPCSIKSIFEYYDIRKENGEDFSVHSINKLAKTSKEFGCEEDDLLELINKVGLYHTQITPDKLTNELERKRPILALFRDELHDGHFAVVIGQRYCLETEKTFIIFHDPWPEFGERFERCLEKFKEQCKPFNNWLMSIHY